MSKTVLAIVENVKWFRKPFYEELQRGLLSDGINLLVLYSEPGAGESLKRDSIALSPPLGMKIPAVRMLGDRLVLQLPPWRLLRDADLLVIVQANGYLLNYPLLLLNCVGAKRVAFWGHSFGHQADSNSVRERFKRWVATKPRWWFTYTKATAAYLASIGFPGSRTTVVENAIDTEAFAEEVRTLRLGNSARTRLGVVDSTIVGLFCGSLYEDKQLPFLLEACKRVHKVFPQFQLWIVGEGPEREWVVKQAADNPWVRYFGAQHGAAKAATFAASDIFLNPGLVGLAILDSFAAGLPFFSTTFKGHSPEFVYLENDVNGVISGFEVAAFADAVIRGCGNPEKLRQLASGAAGSARRYSLRNMVSNVRAGIVDSLKEASP